MANLRETLNVSGTDADKTVEIDRLADLVEAQIGNVLGGGYSQYGGYHGKSVTL